MHVKCEDTMQYTSAFPNQRRILKLSNISWQEDAGLSVSVHTYSVRITPIAKWCTYVGLYYCNGIGENQYVWKEFGLEGRKSQNLWNYIIK